MIDFVYKGENLVVSNSYKKEFVFNPTTKEVSLDGFDVNFPGEYEKSEILLEVQEFQNQLFFKFTMSGKHILILTSDTFELNEEVLSFFGDVDALIIPGTKLAVKLYENIEAACVIPYGEGKDIFFVTVAQNKEEVSSYKLKLDSLGDITEFVNLKIS